MNLATTVQDLKPFLLLFLLPPVPLLALIMMGAGLLRQHRRIGRAMLVLGLLGLWLGCTEGAAQWLSRHLLGTPPALSTERIEALRKKPQAGLAVLVLGGGARPFLPEYEGPGLKPISLERLRYGVWLARRLGAPLGFSGGTGWDADQPEVSEAELATQVVEDEYGLALKWAEARSRDTRENAGLSLPLLKADGIKTLILVTHDMHMPRAQRAFVEAAQGQLEIIAAPVGLRSDGQSRFSDWCPSNEGFARVRYAVYEWLGRKAGH